MYTMTLRNTEERIFKFESCLLHVFRRHHHQVRRPRPRPPHHRPRLGSIRSGETLHRDRPQWIQDHLSQRQSHWWGIIYTDTMLNHRSGAYSYNDLLLTSGQASVTKDYLESIKQGECHMPDGPLFLNPTSLINAFHREVSLKRLCFHQMSTFNHAWINFRSSRGNPKSSRSPVSAISANFSPEIRFTPVTETAWM